MRILYSWLREFVDVPVGPEALATDLSARGFALEGYEALDAGDAVLDFEVTANRPDCMSVAGLAREAATLYGVALRMPGPDAPGALDAASSSRGRHPQLAVSLEAPELCPRYAAGVAAVDVRPSPDWLAKRLHAAGIRPINAVVDVTNYVLLELGQPMHAFDLDRLAGGELRVRTAAPGERLTTLDGVDRALSADMLVIGDRVRPQAIAGVMGGLASEVGPETRRIALESAFFAPISVRRTSKRLGLKTEASARFERGADIDIAALAIARACALLELLGVGRAVPPVVDCYPSRREPVRLLLRGSRIARVLGVSVDAPSVERILTALGFVMAQAHPDGSGQVAWHVTVPTRRVDISREIDLIEEVGRHVGYDRLPATFPALAAPALPSDPRIGRDRLVRQILASAGFSEAMTFTFIERRAAQPFAGRDVAAIANPLSEKFAVLRPSLLPGLLESVAHNRKREGRHVRLYEIGSRFLAGAGETRGVALVWTGAAVDEHWGGGGRPADFFDMKGVVEALGRALGVEPRVEAAASAELVAGRAASLAIDGGVVVGQLGQLAPAVADVFDLDGEEVYVAELDLDRISRAARADVVRAEPLPRFPSVIRDLSVLVPDTLPAATVRGTIRSAAPLILVDVREFDRYQGSGVPAGRVSLSFHLTFRSTERTLTDAEVQRATEAIVDALAAAHGAMLRH